MPAVLQTSQDDKKQKRKQELYSAGIVQLKGENPQMMRLGATFCRKMMQYVSVHTVTRAQAHTYADEN